MTESMERNLAEHVAVIVRELRGDDLRIVGDVVDLIVQRSAPVPGYGSEQPSTATLHVAQEPAPLFKVGDRVRIVCKCKTCVRSGRTGQEAVVSYLGTRERGGVEEVVYEVDQIWASFWREELEPA